jgi:transcriptional regulator with XRE-family HTH domain
MLDLSDIGGQIVSKRRSLQWSQVELAGRASVSRATVAALENGRCAELGFTKIVKLLTTLGLELKVQEASSGRPTLDELLEENRNDQSLGRRR